MSIPASPNPVPDRPRERLWALGPAALTSAELLAILLGTGGGGRDANSIAELLLKDAGGTLRAIAARPRGELLRPEGVGPAKAARLVAAFELAARMSAEARPILPRIREPDDVVRLLSARLRDLEVEEFHLLALDSQSQVRASTCW